MNEPDVHVAAPANPGTGQAAESPWQETFRLLGILIVGLLVGDIVAAALPSAPEWASRRLLASVALSWSVVAAWQHRRGYLLDGLRPGPESRWGTEAVAASRTHLAVILALGLVTAWSLTVLGLTLMSHLPFEPPGAARALHDRLSAGPRWPILVTSLVIAPLCEEVFFRGWLLRAWRPAHHRWTAITAAAVPFALLHVFSWLVALALPLGLLFGWLTVRFRTLLPAIAAHLGANLAPVLMPMVLRGLGYSDAAVEQLDALPWSVGVVGATLCGAGLLGLLFASLRPDPTE